jgi:hypothetical protein
MEECPDELRRTAIDMSKNVFTTHGVDRDDRITPKRRDLSDLNYLIHAVFYVGHGAARSTQTSARTVATVRDSSHLRR